MASADQLPLSSRDEGDLLAVLDWRMALAMFGAFPIALLLIYFTSGIQRKFDAGHMNAKINAANRLQEYLNGGSIDGR